MSKQVTTVQKVIALGVVLLIGAIIGRTVLSTKKTVDNTNKAIGEPSLTVTTAEKPPQDKPILYEMNTDVQFKTLAMRVNSVKASDSISSQTLQQGSKIADNGTKFIVVNITVTNKTAAPLKYIRFDFFDDKQNMFKEAVDNDLTLSQYVDDYLSYKTLNPTVPTTGNLVYIVPASLHSGSIGGINDSDNKQTAVKLNF